MEMTFHLPPRPVPVPTYDQWVAPQPVAIQQFKDACIEATNNLPTIMQVNFANIFGGNEYDVGMCAINDLKFNNLLPTFLRLKEKFQEAESIGTPVTFDYPEVGIISPTTLRYASAALEIGQKFGSAKRIVEVGGGYGALAKALKVVMDWESYTVVDVPEAYALAQAYTSHFGLTVTNEIPAHYDLFIADSSMAECTVEAQETYALLAAQSQFVYITYNTLHTSTGRAGFLNTLSVLNNFAYNLCFVCAPVPGMYNQSIIRLTGLRK